VLDSSCCVIPLGKTLVFLSLNPVAWPLCSRMPRHLILSGLHYL
jgi:hypothetical protein